jgi:RHS repeat-associated protein
MLKDDEVFNGSGNSYTTYFRQHDTRLGRWFSADPEFQPWQSPYTSMDNNPIMFTDPLGNKVGNFATTKQYSWVKGASSNASGFMASAAGGIINQNITRTHSVKFSSDKYGPPNGNLQGGEKEKIGFESGKGTPENPIQLRTVEIAAERGSGSSTGLGSITLWSKEFNVPSGGAKKAQSGGGYNIDKAVNYLNSHAYDPNGPYKYGRGQCSPYTPNAINAGFGDNRIPTNLAGSAYGPPLLKAGFTKVPISNLNNYKPLKGDIAVMNGPSGSKTCNTGIGGPCGHIQMYNGDQWVSDFFQTRKFWPGAAYQDANPQLQFQIYRWITPSP